MRAVSFRKPRDAKLHVRRLVNIGSRSVTIVGATQG
jgi:hypothetical protein